MLEIAALLTACLPAAPDDPVDLHWSFARGEVLRYRMTQRVSTEANGVPVRQEMTTTMSLEVQEVDPKGMATLRAVYEAVAVRASGVQAVAYDSEKDKEPPDDPAARLLSKLVGQSFTMTMGREGTVHDVQGSDRLVEAMLAGVTGGGEPAREKARESLRQSFSDDAFRSRMQQLAPALPPGKVKPGDTWSNDVSLRLPLVDRVTYKIRSRLADVKDGQARIEQEIAVDFTGADDPKNPLAGQVEAKEAKGASTGLFAVAPGRFASQKATVDLVFRIGKTAVPVHVETELALLGRK